MNLLKSLVFVSVVFALTTIASGQDTLKFGRTTIIQELDDGSINIATNPIILQETLDSLYALHERMSDSLQSGTVTGTSKFLRLLETLETGGEVLVGENLIVEGFARIADTTFADGGLVSPYFDTETLTATDAEFVTLNAGASTLASADVTYALDVDGATELDGLNVDGATTMDATTMAGNLTQTGDHLLTGNSDMSGDLDVDGMTELDGLNVDGATTMDATTMAGDLTQTGDHLLTGNSDMSGDLGVDGMTELDGLNVDGATTMDATTMAGDLTQTGDHLLTGNSDVSGTLNAGASTLASASISGDASVGGNTTMTGNASVGGDAVIDGGLTVDGHAELNTTLNVDGTTTMGGGVTITGTGQDDTKRDDYPLLISGVNTGLWIDLAGVANDSDDPLAPDNLEPLDNQNFITFGTKTSDAESVAFGRIEGTGGWELEIGVLFNDIANAFSEMSESSNSFSAAKYIKVVIENDQTPPVSVPYHPGYLMVQVKAAQNSWIVNAPEDIEIVDPLDGTNPHLTLVDTGDSETNGAYNHVALADAMLNTDQLIVWTGNRDNENDFIIKNYAASNKTDNFGNCDGFDCTKWVFIDPISQGGEYTFAVPEESANDGDGLVLRWINPNVIDAPGDVNCSNCAGQTWGANDPENQVSIVMKNSVDEILADINSSAFFEIFKGTASDNVHRLQNPGEEETFQVITPSPSTILCDSTDPCYPRIGDVRIVDDFYGATRPPYYNSDQYSPSTAVGFHGVSQVAYFDIEDGCQYETSGEIGNEGSGLAGNSNYDASEAPSDNEMDQFAITVLNTNALLTASLAEVQMLIAMFQNIIDFTVSFFPPGVPFDFFDILDASNELFMSTFDIFLYVTDGASSTGVQFVSRGADYAEYVPKADPLERMAYGDIVGVKDGLASKSYFEADHYFVVSKAPLVLGNAITDDSESHMEKLAFLGQVPVKVKGIVKPGDYVLACDDGSGVAEAKNPSDMITSDYSRIVGVAWESSEVNQEKRGLRGPYQLVLTAIGLDNNNFVSEMKRVQDEVDNLKEIVNSLVSSLNKLGADIAVPDLQMSSSDVAEEANTTAWAGTIDKMMNATLTNPADEALYEAAKRFENDPVGSRKMFADILESEMEKRFGFDISEEFPWFRKIIEDPEFAANVREVCEGEILGLYEMLEERSNPDKSTSNLPPAKTMPGASMAKEKKMINASNQNEGGVPKPKIR